MPGNAAKTSKKAAPASDGMSADERAAVKERAAELRAAGRRGKAAAKAAAEAQDVLDTIAELPDEDRVLAEQVHGVITATAAPDPAPKPGTACPRAIAGGLMAGVLYERSIPALIAAVAVTQAVALGLLLVSLRAKLS